MKHETSIGNTDTWITPPEIIEQLGAFDLDPCCPEVMPWPTAARSFTVHDDGLLMPWRGRVWLNPPYHRHQIGHWMRKMAMHGFGIALVFNRTDTLFFQDYIFPSATSMFLVRGRMRFYDCEGNIAGTATAPSVFIAYTEFDSDKLEGLTLRGRHLSLSPYCLVGIAYTWNRAVTEALQKIGGRGSLAEIYDAVITTVPGKVTRNRHYKAKIRQTLQFYHTSVERGVWKLSA